jgi:transcriptional regulator with XRE-family HTH domain
MVKQVATVRARGLGAELRGLRNKTGMTVREVGDRLGWSAATLSRTENGLRSASTEDVAALLAVYGISGYVRDRLIAMARENGQNGWLEPAGLTMPSQLPALIGFEAEATEIFNVELNLIPGLLQTPRYTRAQMTAGGVHPKSVEARVATRLGRQAILTKPCAPQFLAILDEAVLRRPIGGREVMAEQLRHLVKLTAQRNVTLLVIPFSVGAHAALTGAYVVLNFEKAPTIVHLEHKRSSLFLDDQADVAFFVQGLTALRRSALTPERSAKFIANVAAEYES